MRILVVNDDGIRAPGLEILATWARKLGDVTVIAPKEEQSAKSHSINIRHPFEAKKVSWLDGIDCYSVESSPADCVRFAVNGLYLDFDLVFSGINKGYNVADDIAYSGTVAAICEAAHLGHKAVAFSTVPISFQWAQESLDRVWKYICDNKYLDLNGLWNVNIPEDPKDILLTRQGRAYFRDVFDEVSPEQYQARGTSFYEKSGKLEEDIDAVMSGFISISPLTVDHTAMDVFRKLRK
ncbi:MAG: 5'/3'-nucleotidase SurE [bacterium]|nr:5'/3'-nucleotidase SurE [bacterium]